MLNTFDQIKNLSLNKDKPLLIFDADEVLVLFANHFSKYLIKEGWNLNLKSYCLDDAIVHIEDGHLADKITYQTLIDDFISRETATQPEAPGASSTLKKFKDRAEIVILTNVPHSAYRQRIKNLSNLDITQPKPISKTEDRNFTEFLRRYLLSAANGNQDAQLSLGYMYETGERVEQDPIEAERWYTKAAQQDNIQAILNLANLLITSSDPDRQLSAINWYEKAGELGNADAQEILGYQYQTGQIIETDLAVAAAWYLKAANQERPAAQNNLARLYQLGQGVEKDLDQAIHWYERAAALGSEAAKNNLKKLLP